MLSFGALLLLASGISGITLTARAVQSQTAVTAEQAFAAAQVAQVAIAIYQVNNSGLHELDEATAAGQIPAGALGRVRAVRLLFAAVQWPDPLRATARELVDHAAQLEQALLQEDAAAAAPEAAAVHRLYHSLTDTAYTWLAQQGGQALPTDEDHDHR
jgi:hypothetical protein